jgi:hypothetical protein
MGPELRRHARLPLLLSAALFVISVVTVWSPPAGRTSWLLEVGPGLVMVLVLAAVYRRLPLSRFVYVCVFLHIQILIYGGYYTYALTPLGEWAKQAFGFARNHYDRVGHVALGVFPSFLAREVCSAAHRSGGAVGCSFWCAAWCSPSRLFGNCSSGGRRSWQRLTWASRSSVRRATCGTRNGTCCSRCWARWWRCRCCRALTIGRWLACRRQPDAWSSA